MKLKKSKYKIVLVLLVLSLALNIFAYADNITQTISVIFNSINIQVNGEIVEADNILYNDTTYVPLRTVAEMLGKDVIWNGDTRTANIKEKIEPGWYLVESSFVPPTELTYTSSFLGTNEKAETNYTVKKDAEGEVLLYKESHYIGGSSISEAECLYNWTKPAELIKEGESFAITGFITPKIGDGYSLSGTVHSFNKLNPTGEWNTYYAIKTSTPETIKSYPLGSGYAGDKTTITLSLYGMGTTFQWKYVYEWKE